MSRCISSFSSSLLLQAYRSFTSFSGFSPVWSYRTVVQARSMSFNQFELAQSQTICGDSSFYDCSQQNSRKDGLWRVANRTKIADQIQLTIYASNRSKLNVAIADMPGPMVHGSISFVTETNTDDGLPHTLEHLVFTGCDGHPYPFDLLVNRCLASGSNAWTAQDHTAYTLTTVGSEGFLRGFSTYIRYTLSPTLTDYRFMTEVHHKKSDGTDAGVVYCEMQDCESDSDSIVERKRREMLYPIGHPYRVETGGRLKNLRENVTNEKIREYHRKFYHLNNMLVIVCGTVDANALLESICGVETDMLDRVQNFDVRPFQTTIKPLSECKQASIEFPADVEAIGTVHLAWILPEGLDNYRRSAVEILTNYMSNTVASPIQKDFVQLSDPYAGEVEFDFREYKQPELVLEFMNVPIEKLPSIKDRFFSNTIAQHSQSNAFNMERMNTIINCQIRAFLHNVESDASSFVIDKLIYHQIYGYSAEQLNERLNFVDIYKKLLNESSEFWANLVKEYLTPSCVCVCGRASSELSETTAEKEIARIEKQCLEIGKEDLVCYERKLQDALCCNNCEVPQSCEIGHFTVQSLSCFNPITINTITPLCNCSVLNSIPVTTFLHQCRTKFMRVYMIWDTSDMSADTRIWLNILSDLVFSSPALVNGKLMPYDELANLYTKDLIDHEFDFEILRKNSNYLTLMLETLEEECDHILKWAEIFLRNSIFCAERIQILVKNLISSEESAKLDGSIVCHSLMAYLFYRKDSNERLFNELVLANFYKCISQQLNVDSTKVIERLEEARNLLLRAPLNIHIQGSNNILSQANKVSSLLQIHKICSSFDDKVQLKHVVLDSCKSLDALNIKKIIALGSIESSFLEKAVPITADLQLEDYSSILLLCEYLSQCEGVLWREIRGGGLAYGATISLKHDNHLRLHLYRSSKVWEAYNAAKKATLRVLDCGLSNDNFESAKRSLVCNLVSKEDTMIKATSDQIHQLLLGRSCSYNRSIIDEVWRADASEVKRRASQYFRTLFDDNNGCEAIVVPLSASSQAQRHFPTADVIQLDDLLQKFSFVDGLIP